MRFSPVFLLLLMPMVVMGGSYRGVGALFGLGIGPLPPGTGGVALGLRLQPEVGFCNPASLGMERGFALSLGYRRPFGALGCLVSGISGRGLGLYALNLDSGEISPGFRYQAYGVVLAAGLGMGKISLGIRWKGLFVPGQGGMAYGWTLDPGIVVRSPDWALGVVAENPISEPISYGGHAESWPRGITLDLWMRLPSPRSSLFLGASFGEGRALELGGGVIASLGDIHLWIGYGEGSFHGGALLSARGFSLGLFSSVTPGLPITFGASMDYRWDTGK